MHLAGRDADLCAHAKLSPIGELGRGIVHDDRAVDGRHEAPRRFLVFCQDGVCMARRVLADKADGLIQPVHDFD